jgi:hypothetical protein
MSVARAVGLAGLLVTSGCALSGAPISPYGRQAEVRATSGSSQRGELIAASADTVWLMSNAGLTPFTTAELRRVEVERHGFGMRRTMKWMGWLGVGTGIALMISCNSYESSSEGSGDGGSCVGVLPGSVIFFGLTGALLGMFNESSRHHHFKPAETDRIRPYARFPQGMPDSLRLRPLPPRQP